MEELDFQLREGALDRFSGLGQTHSPQAVLAAITGLLVRKYTDQEKITLAFPVSTAFTERRDMSICLPLQFQIGPEVTFEELLEATQDLFLLLGMTGGAASFMPDVTLKELDETLKRVTSHALYFPSLHGPVQTIADDFDLSFKFSKECTRSPRLHIVFNRALYRSDTIQRIAYHYSFLMTKLVEHAATPISQISLMDPAEQSLLLSSYQQAERDFPLNDNVHELFQRQARISPQSIAIEDGDTKLSYAVLDADSNRLARCLQGSKLEPGDIVPIVHGRNVRFLTAALAVLKTGAAFLPVDPNYPADRIRYMLSHTLAKLMISESEDLQQLITVVEPTDIQAVILTDRRRNDCGTPQVAASQMVVDRSAWESQSDQALPNACDGRSRAYLVFTSGSTGLPKGVVIRHDGTINHIYAEAEALTLNRKTRFLHTAQLSTDLCIWQFLAPLLVGGRSVVAQRQDVVDPQRLLRLLQTRRISLVELVPIVLKGFVDYVAKLSLSVRALPSLEWMMVTGESTPPQLINAWFELYPDIPVVNAYGPSEVSDDTAQHIMRGPLPEDCRSVPAGVPLPNLRVHILDAHDNLVPIGVPGEICVAGIGVADGYWRETEATRASFVPNPFPKQKGEIMYKTGDLGRWLGDGTIELLGRIDQQTKIRGYRIEPREIEVVLADHPAVRQCVVAPWGDDAQTKRLVAYVVVKEPVESNALRGYLSSKLPEYMVPGAITFLDAIPMTPNGVKVDFLALPRPAYDPVALSTDHVDPSNDTERMLATAWSDVLGIDRIGMDDNFFELGGNSLQTVDVADRVGELGLYIPVAGIFSHPTIRRLATLAKPRHLPETRSNAEVKSPVSASVLAKIKEKYPGTEQASPLSPTQRGIYLNRMLSRPDTGVYIEQISGIICGGHFDSESMQKAWLTVAQHHPVLRTRFVRRGLPGVYQIVYPTGGISYNIQDGRKDYDTDGRSYLDSLEATELATPFRLDEPPLVRIVVTCIAADEHHFIWTYPHILLDGWSEAIVLSQVLKTYEALCAGNEPDLPIARPYIDFVSWIHNQDLQKARIFWRNELAGFTTPNKLVFRSSRNPENASDRRYGYARVEQRLPQDLVESLHFLCNKQRWTVNTVLQGAWGILLSRYSHDSDILFGSAVSGRQIELSGISSMVGLLVNSVPIRMRTSDNRSVRDWLTSVQESQFRIREYEYTPLSEIEKCSDVPRSARPLFSSYFVFANFPDEISLGTSKIGVSIRDLRFHTLPEYPITLFVQPGQRFLVRLLYDRAHYAANSMRELIEAYCRLVADIIKRPEQTPTKLVATNRP
jgi:amino acid adenylation domain-containing protein